LDVHRFYPKFRLEGKCLSDKLLGQREFEQAEDYYQRALDLYVEFGDRFWQAGAYHQLGTVAGEQCQWAAAESYYQQALAIKIEFGDRYSQASTYGQLGILAQEQGEWAAAGGYFLKALEIFAEYDDEHYLGVTLRNLARLWAAGGDAGLPAAVAGVLGVGAGEVEEMLRRRRP